MVSEGLYEGLLIAVVDFLRENASRKVTGTVFTSYSRDRMLPGLEQRLGDVLANPSASLEWVSL